MYRLKAFAGFYFKYKVIFYNDVQAIQFYAFIF